MSVNKLTYEQSKFIVMLERMFPQLDWQGIAVTKGYDHMLKVWEYWNDNIKDYLND